MKALLRWLLISLGMLIGLALVGAVAVYLMSERVLHRRFPAPAAISLSLPTDPAEIAEGRRLATLLNCFGACHGKHGEGSVMFDEPVVAHIVAPNLPSAARRFSAAELATIIRHGVRPDGSSLMIMPSEAFHALTDQDLGRIVAVLKA